MGKASRAKKEKRAAGRPQVQSVPREKVEGLLGKLRAAEEAAAPLDLSAEDLQLTQGIVETWSYLMTRLRAGKLTIKEMKQLAGMVEEAKKRAAEKGSGGGGVPASDAPADGAPDGGEQTSAGHDGDQPTRHEHGRRDAAGIGEHEHECHEHDVLVARGPCPAAGCTGRLYPGRPQVFTTISAEPPFRATKHTVEVLACNKCKGTFPAPLPRSLSADLHNGNGSHLYAISAAVMMTLLRYFSGFPWYRQEGFFTAIGGPRIPDSSMADQSERVANAFHPIYVLLRKMAKGAWLLMSDDTGNRIRSLPMQVKEQRRTGKPTDRNGCHTTATIALVGGEAERRIVLFDTGIHYSGEVLDKLLAGRDGTLPRPYVVGDGSPHNEVTVTKVVRCGCNAHAVRKFKDARLAFPVEAGRALAVYDEIYRLEAEIKAAGLSADERLARHQAISRPLLAELCRYGQSLFDDRLIEPNNDDIAAAYNYLLNQQRELMAFTRYAGIPLDNNEDERAIKLIVLVRKNSQHFATVAGAGHADVLWSCGATALRAGENLWDYMNAVIRHQDQVRLTPEAFLPWNWRATVERLRLPASAAADQISTRERREGAAAERASALA